MLTHDYINSFLEIFPFFAHRGLPQQSSNSLTILPCILTSILNGFFMRTLWTYVTKDSAQSSAGVVAA